VTGRSATDPVCATNGGARRIHGGALALTDAFCSSSDDRSRIEAGCDLVTMRSVEAEQLVV
jgi:hypothetical protein